VANWWDCIAWTNIAKIAPSARGNPPNWLGIAQSAAAWELVHMEVRELNPAVILCVTGSWVDRPRLDSIEARPRASSEYVRHSSRYDGRKWLVVERPECKVMLPIVAEIKTALNELD
jgi:hypothetical protein